jgi:hypothetical protein
MGALQALESGRLAIIVGTEHAEYASGAGVAHVIDLGIWDVILPDILPHIRLGPE